MAGMVAVVERAEMAVGNRKQAAAVAAVVEAAEIIPTAMAETELMGFEVGPKWAEQVMQEPLAQMGLRDTEPLPAAETVKRSRPE